MTSVVNAPESPLGSYENPHPFKKGEKRIKDDIYFNSLGVKKRWDGKGLRDLPTSGKLLWNYSHRYDTIIQLLKNTKLTLVWSKKEFNDNKEKNRCTRNNGEKGAIRILIKHSCGCSKLRTIGSLRKSVEVNNYLCGGGNRMCLKLNGTTFNEDKTKKYCSLCKKMLLLSNFGSAGPSKGPESLNSCCYDCRRNKAKKFREESIENRLSYCLMTCKRTTADRNKKGRQHDEVEIDLKYVLELWEKCNGICYRFKKKMSALDDDKWCVCIDRIDSNKGYIKGNVQLVCRMYNTMKMDKTEEEMDEVFEHLRQVYSNTSPSRLL